MKRFSHAGAFALFATLIFTAPLLFAADPGGHDHTPTGIQNTDDLMQSIQANTPEKHREIAAYYRNKATDEKNQAKDHRKMSHAYLGSKALYHQTMKEHCDKLVALHEKLAGEYEALASEHGPAGHDHTKPGVQNVDDLTQAIQAGTPEKHLEIAAYYRAKAGDAKKQTEDHRKMSNSYLGSKALYHQAMKKHCDKLVTLHEGVAGEYEALAAEHEAAAKK